MDDLTLMIRKYAMGRDRLIKKICAPLQDSLGIAFFNYYFLGNDGRYFVLSNYPEELEYYFSHSWYLNNPMLVHPSLKRSGCANVPISFDPTSLELLESQFHVYNLFLIQKHSGTGLEGAIFCSNESKEQRLDYVYYLPLLHKFIAYFKKSAESLLKEMKENSFDLGRAKGAKFLESDPLQPLSIADPKVRDFLKKVSPLTKREEEVLQLFKQGRSAQATGAILKLSPRTVESYFENIKSKLNCQTKGELLEW